MGERNDEDCGQELDFRPDAGVASVVRGRLCSGELVRWCPDAKLRMEG